MTATLPIAPISPLPSATVDAGAQNWLDVQGLEPLKAQAGTAPHDPATLRAVAQQFEALMINMMMKSMREAKLGDGLFDSDQTRLYQDLFDEQLSMSMSQGKGLGIADLLVRSLTPHGAAAGAALGTYHKAPKRPAMAGVSSLLDVARDAGTAAASTGAVASSPEEFVALVMPEAEAAAAKLGVDPLALVAQAALESNWGRQIPTADGSSSNNLFGIKADPAWTGRRTIKDTVEYAGGVAERRREPFRAYESVAHGFDDYVALLKGSSRFSAALQQGTNGEGFAQALHRAGYATDPDYSTKMTAILRSSVLRNAVASLKKPDEPPIF
jgi:flagellar protein FlgJ